MPPIFTHIAFLVTDLNRSISFYEKYCGLKIYKDKRKRGGSYVWLAPPVEEGKKPKFSFVLSEDKDVDPVDHIGFQCNSKKEIDQIAELAQKDGCLEDGPIDYGGSVGYYILLRDPDGHIIEFTFGQDLEGVH